jgi:hypothetical protein
MIVSLLNRLNLHKTRVAELKPQLTALFFLPDAGAAWGTASKLLSSAVKQHISYTVLHRMFQEIILYSTVLCSIFEFLF